jgi:amidase
VDAAITRIEALDPLLGALVDTRFERARHEARGSLPDGPFRGVPLLIKTVQHSAGDRYQHGMRFLATTSTARPPTASSCVGIAAAVSYSRTHQGARARRAPRSRSPGAAHNPWNVDHTTGGSAAARVRRSPPGCRWRQRHGRLDPHPIVLRARRAEPSRHRTSLYPYGEYWGPLTHEHVLHPHGA